MIGEALMIAALSLLAALAWYPCCCAGTSECSFCSADSDTVTVLLSAAPTDDLCGCSELGGYAFAIARTASPCVWQNSIQDGEMNCTGLESWFSGYSFRVEAKNLGLTPKWGYDVRLTMSNRGGVNQTVIWQWGSTAEAAFDCTAERTATFVSEVSGEACDNFSSITCTIN